MIRDEDAGFVNTNLDRIIPNPIKIPTFYGNNIDHKIRVSIYQLNLIYSFLAALEKQETGQLPIPLRLPIWNNFSEDNPEFLTKSELSTVVKYIYSVTKLKAPKPDDYVPKTTPPPPSNPIPASTSQSIGVGATAQPAAQPAAQGSRGVTAARSGP